MKRLIQAGLLQMKRIMSDLIGHTALFLMSKEGLLTIAIILFILTSNSAKYIDDGS